jgi:hypothetical protein
MAKGVSRLISPQRAKTNAKHAQNAAYNQAQIAAQSGQPLPTLPKGTQQFDARQRTNLKHMQNAAYNQGVQNGTITPEPAPTAITPELASQAQGGAGAVLPEQAAQVGIGGFEQGQIQQAQQAAQGALNQVGGTPMQGGGAGYGAVPQRLSPGVYRMPDGSLGNGQMGRQRGWASPKQAYAAGGYGARSPFRQGAGNAMDRARQGAAAGSSLGKQWIRG